MIKFYFEVGSENCYPLDYFQDRIDDGEKEIHLELAKRDIGSGYAWCKQDGMPLERGDGNCGKLNCDNYKPRNKISGRCVQSVNCFTPIGNILILTKDGLTPNYAEGD